MNKLIFLVFCLINSHLIMAFDFFDFSLFSFDKSSGNSKNISSDESEESESVLEDASATTPKLIKKYGYPSEIHYVTTDDGYILEIHRIAKSKGQPILLIHGILDTSATWVLMGPKSSLGYFLYDQGYDVWLGNVRGNRYSRRHEKINANKKQFWNFSFHEMGVFDLPAMIDFILATTGYNKLHYAGHSQGTTTFWVMCSEKPSYVKKVKSMHALAPVAFLPKIKSPFIRAMVVLQEIIDTAGDILGIHEYLPNKKSLVRISQRVCQDSSATQGVCSNILFLIAGYDSDQLNTTMLPTILSHTPSGSSAKQLQHFGQIITAEKFKKFDYGSTKNRVLYGKPYPPEYNLTNVQLPVCLYFATNDWIVNPLGVDELAKRLPFVFDKYLIQNEKFNHLDFLWAVDVKNLLYARLLRNLKEIEKNS